MPIPFLVKSVKNLSYLDDKFTLSWPKFVEWYSSRKAIKAFAKVKPFIVGENILDVGFGAGTIGKIIATSGYNLTGIDVADLSIYSDLKAVIYDGVKMPFKNKQFDTAVIIHVLHHCSDPVATLIEAKRCAKRVVFIEDTYRNSFEKAIVSFNDNLGNWEFYQHPYQTDLSWRQTIQKLGYKLIYQQSWTEMSPSILPSRYCLCVIE
ncbi:MAG: class I SAM-dependent methyltransferase [Microgenomates group bacterium]